MLKSIAMKDIESYIPILSVLFDKLRFADPINRIILDYSDGVLKETGELCYHCWGKENLCENCVSAHACNKSGSVVKLVVRGTSVTLVMAIPVTGAGRLLSLELMKDITDGFVSGLDNEVTEKKLCEALEELSYFVIRDQLTGIYNRRFVDDRLSADLQKANDSKAAVSLIFIDIDDFKGVNDRYGHSTGDFILKKAADILRSAIRNNFDWAARYGGDEFIIYLSEADENNARAIADRILKSVSEATLMVDQTPLHFTVSVGVHSIIDHRLTAGEIIHIADQNMYEVKCRGKNSIKYSYK